MQVKLLWRSVKIVLLILKGSDAEKFSINTGIEKLSILTVCCFSQVPKERVECNIFTYLYAWTAQRLSVSWTNILMCPFNLNPGDITGDFKLVCSSAEDILLQQSIVMIQPYYHFVFFLQQTSFHLTSLSKRLFLVAFLILTMLHCVHGECELRLLAFDVLRTTIPDLPWLTTRCCEPHHCLKGKNQRGIEMRWMLTSSKWMRTTLVDHFEMTRQNIETLCMSPSSERTSVQKGQCMHSVNTQGSCGASKQPNVAC